jgi:hypothetical protein
MNLLRRFDGWWFSEERSASPAVFRILLLGFACFDYATRVVPRANLYVGRPAEFYRPISVLRWLGLPIPSATLMGVLLALAVVALGLSFVGLRTRHALCVFALLNLYLEAFLSSWGYIAHSAALPALMLLLLPLMPRVDEISVDALSRKHKPNVTSTRFVSGWPIRLCLVLVCLFYFASGVAKLRYSGLSWADGRTLAFYLSGGSPRGQSVQHFIASREPEAPKWRDGVGLVDYAYVAEPTALGRRIAASPLLTRLLATFTLLLELTFPLALVGRRTRYAYFAAGALLHIGVMLSMRIDFTSFLVAYTLFIDFRGLGARLRTHPRTVKTGRAE